ncbi:hydroxyacid dehydrogenase [bacterium]|nr:hydroxyacid dehydrogenase [bacterium]
MKILVADKFPEDKLAAMNSLGHQVTFDPEASAETLPEKIGDHEVLIVRSTVVSAATIDAGKALALVIRAGAGYNTIDVAQASARGIFVANCPGKNSVAVAELAMGLMIGMDRRIPQCTAELRAHKWNKKEYSKADGLKGKTIGVVGLGQIGQALAARAKAFEMNVIGWSRSLTPEKAKDLGVGFCGNLEELCEKADVISIHLAQNADTKKLFDQKLFNLMKTNTIFINTSRGGIVDQEALKKAMREKNIRAALDVYDPEPASGKADFEDEILDMPNLIGTHHIGASTNQAQDAIAEETIRIIREFATKGEVPNCVNIEDAPPAKCTLVVRHFDKVGVLANVMDKLKAEGLNIEDMSNTVFQGAKAAVAVLRLSEMPGEALLKTIEANSDEVIHVEAKKC